MTSAPLSTDQRMASAICSVNDRVADDPKPTDTDSSSASGATPIMPAPVPVPRPAAREATQLPWLAVDRADGRSTVGRADPRDIRAADDGALELDGSLADAGVDDRDAHAGAARRLPGLRDAVVVEPVLGRAHRIFTSGASGTAVAAAAAATRVIAAAVTAATTATRPRVIRPIPGCAQTQRSGDQDDSASARSPIGLTPGPAASACPASACRHFTRVGIPPAEMPSISSTSPKAERSRRYASWAEP